MKIYHTFRDVGLFALLLASGSIVFGDKIDEEVSAEEKSFERNCLDRGIIGSLTNTTLGQPKKSTGNNCNIGERYSELFIRLADTPHHNFGLTDQDFRLRVNEIDRSALNPSLKKITTIRNSSAISNYRNLEQSRDHITIPTLQDHISISGKPGD